MTITPLHPAEAAAPAADPTPGVETAYVPAPHGASGDAPRIFQVIHGVMRDVMPVAKGQRNTQQNYQFRGVDDAMSAMAGPMRNHGCFIAPEIIEHRQRPRGEKGTHTVITMRFRIYGPAGDCLLVTVPGEAMDTADKSTNKAMSAALKYMLFQVFMIPIDARSIDDSDRDTPVDAPRQRQQGGKNQRQCRSGQPRRSNRAEPGPWEQPPPERQRGPSRDYLAAARAAADVATVRRLHAQAKDEGAPAEYLAQIADIGSTKPGAKHKQQDTRQPAAPPPQPAAREGEIDAEHAAALGEMYDAAKTVELNGRGEADEAFTARYGCAPSAATAAQLRDMRDDLLDAVRGAA